MLTLWKSGRQTPFLTVLASYILVYFDVIHLESNIWEALWCPAEAIVVLLVYPIHVLSIIPIQVSSTSKTVHIYVRTNELSLHLIKQKKSLWNVLGGNNRKN